MKIGYLYYNFYPVTGGPSIHGYYLARELSNMGHELVKLNGEPDPFTQKKNPLTGFLSVLKNCDIIYLRADYFLKIRNLMGAIAMYGGKKVVVELNAPSDELHLFGKSRKTINRADRVASTILREAGAVVVVSDQVRAYCEEELNLTNVHVVENGGEVFSADLSGVSGHIINQVESMKKNWDRLVVWSGSVNRMQDIDQIKTIAAALRNEAAFAIIANPEPGSRLPDFEEKNITCFTDCRRAEVEYIISQSDTGLALYGDYSWSRWGFYNNSLKVYEYLNNGLLTICNKPASDIQARYPNFRHIRNFDEILTFTREPAGNIGQPQNIRTWQHVAQDVSTIMKQVHGS